MAQELASPKAAVRCFIYPGHLTAAGDAYENTLPAFVSSSRFRYSNSTTEEDENCDHILTHTFNPLPDQTQLLAELTRQFATVALKLWPTWYGQTQLFYSTGHSTDTLLNRFTCLDLRASRYGINLPWMKSAVQACMQGKPPVLDNFPTGLQLSQLALAIAPGPLNIAISITDPQPLDHCLLALAKTLPWLAEHTKANVDLLVPQPLAHAPALMPILYDAVVLPEFEIPERRARPAAQYTEEKYLVHPVQGRPHPFSPGEQLLAQRLAQDAELGPLFHFNQSLQTVRHSRYLVDLLWLAGQMVVEIDGYQYHSNRDSFSRDRQRDYELLVSGYIVLRLPHDEVIDDVEVAVEKIRDLVRFRRATLPANVSANFSGAL